MRGPVSRVRKRSYMSNHAYISPRIYSRTRSRLGPQYRFTPPVVRLEKPYHPYRRTQWLAGVIQTDLTHWLKPMSSPVRAELNPLTDQEFERVTSLLGRVVRGRLSSWTPEDTSHEEQLFDEAESNETS